MLNIATSQLYGAKCTKGNDRTLKYQNFSGEGIDSQSGGDITTTPSVPHPSCLSAKPPLLVSDNWYTGHGGGPVYHGAMGK